MMTKTDQSYFKPNHLMKFQETNLLRSWLEGCNHMCNACKKENRFMLNCKKFQIIVGNQLHENTRHWHSVPMTATWLVDRIMTQTKKLPDWTLAEFIIFQNGKKLTIRLMMINCKDDADIQHALISRSCIFLVEVTCTVGRDRSVSVLIRFLFMILNKLLSIK